MPDVATTFSKKKLSKDLVLQLETILESLSYTCGSTFNDINFPEGMDSVCVRVHSCLDPIEKLYYSCGFDPICIYCGQSVELDSSPYYPQCSSCVKPKIKKQTRRGKK